VSVKVVTTSPGFGKAGDLPTRIAEAGWSFHRTDAAGLDAHLADMDFLVAGLPRVTAELIDRAPRLKAVLKHGVGLDSIDVSACTARGIPVLSTPGANAIAVAELALAAIFALSRNLVAGHLSVTSGGWDRRPGREVEGATLGIVGFGAIGKTLARKARALEMRVLATDPYPDTAFAEKLGVSLVPLEALLVDSDFVSLHVFGGAGNAALIGAAQLAAMRPGACLLNLARGEVVDLDALAVSLASGHLGGAAIDAYVTEPPDTAHPIFRDPRVIFSPHSGADTEGSLIRMGGMVIDDIAEILAGHRPTRVVNPEAFDRKGARP
jgi:D-3-phosphoglycerate dehydrogenase